MNNRIRIAISSNPLHGQSILIWLQNPELGYDNTQGFTFVSGVPATANQIQIGATQEETLENIFQVFTLAYSGLIVTKVFPSVFIDFYNPSEAIATELVNTTLGAITVTVEVVADIPPTTIAEYDFNDLSIQIIDTYENDRSLRVELTAQSAPVLRYDSGETIMEPIMASELSFNMLADNFRDAFFKHLFTGDEKRYEVKLNGIDEEENAILLWQGFLLPDLLREPYVNGNLFVEFTATDMLGTLKAKYFKPWEYHRKINIMRLLAEILAQTGVNQKMIVMPAMVPANALIPWYHLNLELSVYYDDKKGENLYALLESVLKSNLLTIYSYRDYWWIEGANRKFDVSGNGLLFDEDGVFENLYAFERKINAFDFVKGSLFIDSKTPFKEVKIIQKAENRQNIFPDDVVNREAYFGVWEDDQWNEDTQKTSYLDYWLKVGTGLTEFKNAAHVFRFGNKNAYDLNDYVVSEQSALNNYYKLKLTPFIIGGIRYKIKMDVELKGSFLLQATDENISPKIKANHFQKFFIYQLFCNGNEILSNRPSFNATIENEFFVEYASKDFTGPFDHTLKFTLDGVFETNVSGLLELRILEPISTGLVIDYLLTDFTFKVNTLTIEPEQEEDFTLIAERNVEFSTAIEHNVDIVTDNKQGNHFGLGMQLLPYETTIVVEDQVYVENTHTFNNNSINKIFSWRFKISVEIENLLFKELRSKACYLTRENGFQEFFNSLYTKRVIDSGNFLRPHIYYLVDKIGSPKVPKEYRYIDKIESGDVLKLLLSNYPEENLAERLRWKINGETGIQTFVQTLAKIIHQTHPDSYYKIDGTVLGLHFPGEILGKYYDGDNRNFVSTRLELNLFDSKTTVTAREIKNELLTDITYE